MKKFKQKFILLFIGFGLLYANTGYCDIIRNKIEDDVAILNTQYHHDVNVFPIGDSAFYIDEGPAGMTIDPDNGLITYTPTSLTDGGKVIVRAQVGAFADYDTFYVYISDAVECAENMISYWKLDEDGGPVYKDFANGHDATISGTSGRYPVAWPNGRVDTAQLFNPSTNDDQFLEVLDDAYDFRDDDNFAVSLWFKNKSHINSDNEVWIAKDGTQFWWLGFRNNDNRLAFEFWDGASVHTPSVTAINDTNWHHLVVNFHGSTTTVEYIRFCIDGDYSSDEWHDVGSHTINFTGDDPLNIGYWKKYSTNVYPATAVFDDIAFFNNSLSSAEVSELYSNGLAGLPQCRFGNITPLVVSDPVTSIEQDQVYSYTVVANELNPGDSIILADSIVPGWLSFNPVTGLLNGTPTNDNIGDTTVIIKVSDETVEILHSFNINVININDPPTVESTAPTAVNEDEPYSYTFVAEDIDKDDVVTLSAEDIPGWLNFNPSTGLLSGTPTNDQVGLNPTADFDVTLRATDLALAYDEEIFTITVTNINDAPVIDSQNTIETDEDTDREIVFADLSVTDVDDTYPDDFTLTVQNGNNYTHSGNIITPAQNWYGELTVPITLSDGDSTVNYELDVTVISVNDPPEFTSTPITEAAEGSDYEYWFTATDVEDANLTFTAVKKPDWLDISSSALAGLLQGKPGYQDAGLDSVVLKVEDSDSAFDEQVFAIDVEDVETGLRDNEIRLVNIVYPNPANKNEPVIFELNQFSGKTTLQIFNVTGELVTEVDILNEQVIKLNIDEYNTGLYLYKIINNNKYQTGQLLIK
jgi:hypothetical protein